jgi:hypothetical protein
MIVKFRERLAVGKQAAQRFDGQRFNLRKLNEPEVRGKYQILKRISKPQRKRVWVCTNLSRINPGLMKNV